MTGGHRVALSQGSRPRCAPGVTVASRSAILRRFVWTLSAAAVAPPVAVLGAASPTVAEQGGGSEARTTAVHATHTLVAETRLDNGNGQTGDDDYQVLRNRLDLLGQSGDLTAVLRLDAMAFRSRPPSRRPDEPSPYSDAAQLERFSLQYQRGRLRAVAGDFYRQLGRGIALAVRQGEDNGVDFSIRGGELELDAAAAQAFAFAGVINRANVDSVSQRAVQDVNDFVAGSQLELRTWGAATLGIYGLHLRPQVGLLPGVQDHGTTGGGYVEIPRLVDGLSVYAEVDGQAWQLAGGAPTTGLAAYATVDFQRGDTTVLLEGLWLDGFEQLGSPTAATGTRSVYNRPPTLERVEDEVQNHRSARGGRGRLEHYVADLDLLVYGNAVARQNDFREDTDVRSLQWHGYGGFERYLQEGRSRVAASGGYRQQRQGGDVITTMVHGELDALAAMPHGLAWHLTSQNELRTLEDRRYGRGSTFIGLQRTGLGEAVFEWGYDTQNPRKGVRRRFYAGIVSWDALPPVQVRAVVGTQRGGLKCVSGVCREYPAFAGARVEVVGRI